MTPINIVNVSGGVDSTACYLLALEEREKTGMDFRAVFADTGNEHQMTIDYVNELTEKTGGPKIQTVKADFTQRIAARRIKLEMMLETGCFKEGWNEENVKRVLEHLHPTGVPFLDMCMWKGRFPSTMVRFCTQELKLEAIKRGATEPAICEMIARGGDNRATSSTGWGFAGTRARPAQTHRCGIRKTTGAGYIGRWLNGRRPHALICCTSTAWM